VTRVSSAPATTAPPTTTGATATVTTPHGLPDVLRTFMFRGHPTTLGLPTGEATKTTSTVETTSKPTTAIDGSLMDISSMTQDDGTVRTFTMIS
jgi:hypothetical protein